MNKFSETARYLTKKAATVDPYIKWSSCVETSICMNTLPHKRSFNVKPDEICTKYARCNDTEDFQQTSRYAPAFGSTFPQQFRETRFETEYNFDSYEDPCNLLESGYGRKPAPFEKSTGSCSSFPSIGSLSRTGSSAGAAPSASPPTPTPR